MDPITAIGSNSGASRAEVMQQAAAYAERSKRARSEKASTPKADSPAATNAKAELAAADKELNRISGKKDAPAAKANTGGSQPAKAAAPAPDASKSQAAPDAAKTQTSAAPAPTKPLSQAESQAKADLAASDKELSSIIRKTPDSKSPTAPKLNTVA